MSDRTLLIGIFVMTLALTGAVAFAIYEVEQNSATIAQAKSIIDQISQQNLIGKASQAADAASSVGGQVGNLLSQFGIGG